MAVAALVALGAATPAAGEPTGPGPAGGASETFESQNVAADENVPGGPEPHLGGGSDELGPLPEMEPVEPDPTVVAAEAFARQRAIDAREALLEAETAENAAVSAVREADEELADAELQLGSLEGAASWSAAKLDDAQRQLDATAASLYVNGGVTSPTALLDVEDPTVAATRNELSRFAGDHVRLITEEHRRTAGKADSEAKQAAARIGEARRDLEASRAALAAATERKHRAVEDVAVAEAAHTEAALMLAASSGQAPALPELPAGADFSSVALDAYRRAAHYANTTFPGCGIGWWHVAGIAKIETGHGTYGGSRVLPNGDVRPLIRGIALDGRPGIAHIADTDGGVFDGDTVYDRAVGPTQFIPSTWAGYATMFDLDGDGNGVEDPNNIYDAGRATAILLCRSTDTMSTQAGARRAFFAYNRSGDYVNKVWDWSVRYAAWTPSAVPEEG